MKSDKKPYDTAFKRLADQDPEALLRLVGALPAGATARKLPREISAPALATDQPYEVIGVGQHYIAHIEAQTRWKSNVPNRITEYDAIFWVTPPARAQFRADVHSRRIPERPAGPLCDRS